NLSGTALSSPTLRSDRSGTVMVSLSFMRCGFWPWQFSIFPAVGLCNSGTTIGIGPGSAICDGSGVVWNWSCNFFDGIHFELTPDRYVKRSIPSAFTTYSFQPPADITCSKHNEKR